MDVSASASLADAVAPSGLLVLAVETLIATLILPLFPISVTANDGVDQQTCKGVRKELS